MPGQELMVRTQQERDRYVTRMREIALAFDLLNRRQTRLAEQMAEENATDRLEEIKAETAEYKERLRDWSMELARFRSLPVPPGGDEAELVFRQVYDSDLLFSLRDAEHMEQQLESRIQEVRSQRAAEATSPLDGGPLEEQVLVVAGTSGSGNSLADRARSFRDLTGKVLAEMHTGGLKDNFRLTPLDEEGQERFEDMKALDIAVQQAADDAGIKRERPDISLIADGAINIGTFRDGEYIPTALGNITEPFSMNSLHITPSMGLRPYIPQPNLTEEELSELDEKYGVKELRNRLRDIMLGYRIDEYDGIRSDLGARRSIMRASERMIAAVNELTSSSAMFQAIHSSDPEERVWAQKTMFEIFESAGNEYEHLANEYIDSLDPETLEKKSREREAYAREMRSMGEQGIRHISDPSNMFGAFVLMNFCPPLAVALLAPMLLPNLIAWASQRGADSAAFAAKDLYSLRLQEKSGVMTAKVVGNTTLARVVPPLVAGVSPEEMSRLIDSVKDDMRAWGGKTQEELMKILGNVSKLCADGKTVEPGSAAFAELDKGMKALGIEVAGKMLDITGGGELGVAVNRMQAVRDMAEAAPGAELFESVDSEGGLAYEFKSRKIEANETSKNPLFKSKSVVVKNMAESIIKDGENYISNLGRIQKTITAFNRNITLYLREQSGGGKEKVPAELLEDILEQQVPQASGESAESSLLKSEMLRGTRRIQDAIRRNTFLGQMTQSDAVMSMISLRKPGDTKLGQNMDDSSFHYVRYGMARDDKGVRVGRNIDVKPPAIFSVMKVMGEKVGNEERSETQLKKKQERVENLLAELESFSALPRGSAEEARATRKLRNLVKETRSAYAEHKNNKPEGTKTKEDDPDSTGFREGVLLPLVKTLGLSKDRDASAQDAQEKWSEADAREGADKLRDIDLPLLARETRLESDRVKNELKYCKTRGHDMLSAFMSDMSMRIVPQEAWGAIYTLDRKFMDAIERNQRAETRVKEEPRVKAILKDNSRERARFDLVAQNAALAAEKLHEANKLSIAAFVMSKQLQAETERRVARGGNEPSPAENMVASIMTGMLSQAASLEMEAAPIMAKAVSMSNEGFSKDFSAPVAAALTTIVSGHARSVAELTGGDLLYKRIGQAEENLGYDIRKVTGEEAFKKAFDSGLLSGSVLEGGLSEEMQKTVSFMESPDWEGGGAELKSAREAAAEHTRELYIRQKERDQRINDEFRGLLNVDIEKVREEGPPEKWKDTVSLLTSWSNETSMSGLVTRLVGSHLDAEVGGTAPLPGKQKTEAPKTPEEPASDQGFGFLDAFNL